MSDTERIKAARCLLSSLPLVMRTIGEGLRRAEVEMSPVQHRLLMQIGHRPRTLRDIARLQGVTPATATSIVTTLENKGWVVREHDTEDRRVVRVVLTAEGREALRIAQRVAENAVAELLEALDDKDVSKIITGCDALSSVTHS